MAASIGSLKGLVSLITGGASGMGKATVEWFVKRGAKVVICDLPNSNGEEVAKTLGDDSCIFVPTDDSLGDGNGIECSVVRDYFKVWVVSEDDVSKALDVTEKKFGRLDTVVNCAAIGVAFKMYNQSKNKPQDLEPFLKVMEVNAGGTFNVMRLAVGLMIKNKPNQDGQRGVIVNTASISAYEGQIGQVTYAASKGAIVSMTLPTARDLADVGIRVNAIAPGYFDTPLLGHVPFKVRKYLSDLVLCPSRLAFPEEYAHLVETIICNPFLNGEIIRLDGGLRLLP